MLSDLVIDIIEMHNRGIKATDIADQLDIPFHFVEVALDAYEAEWDLAFYGPTRENMLGA